MRIIHFFFFVRKLFFFNVLIERNKTVKDPLGVYIIMDNVNSVIEIKI